MLWHHHGPIQTRLFLKCCAGTVSFFLTTPTDILLICKAHQDNNYLDGQSTQYTWGPGFEPGRLIQDLYSYPRNLKSNLIPNTLQIKSSNLILFQRLYGWKSFSICTPYSILPYRVNIEGKKRELHTQRKQKEKKENRPTFNRHQGIQTSLLLFRENVKIFSKIIF